MNGRPKGTATATTGTASFVGNWGQTRFSSFPRGRRLGRATRQRGAFEGCKVEIVFLTQSRRERGAAESSLQAMCIDDNSVLQALCGSAHLCGSALRKHKLEMRRLVFLVEPIFWKLGSDSIFIISTRTPAFATCDAPVLSSSSALRCVAPLSTARGHLGIKVPRTNEARGAFEG